MDAFLGEMRWALNNRTAILAMRTTPGDSSLALAALQLKY